MKRTTYQDYRERILKVLVFVQEHLDEDLSIEGLARRAHFSSYHFHRIFTGMVGESVMEYVRRLRLQRAAQRLKQTRAAFVRHVGPYMECGATWKKLVPRLGALGLLGPDTRFLGLGHDDPDATPPGKIRYDACVTVDEDFEPEGQIGVQIIGGGEYAVTTHHGPYEGLADTYADLCGKWLPRCGREARAAPCMEIHLNDPESTEPAELLTEIYLPLEPRR
ncbi:MAG: helix-turn-helix domain-containing protein [Candidatus Latescibacteria bacterium]|nr:helix-turn-helix domain-containing protein [Candidatus Latescibacterota bacterium]